MRVEVLDLVVLGQTDGGSGTSSSMRQTPSAVCSMNARYRSSLVGALARSVCEGDVLGHPDEADRLPWRPRTSVRLTSSQTVAPSLVQSAPFFRKVLAVEDAPEVLGKP